MNFYVDHIAQERQQIGKSLPKGTLFSPVLRGIADRDIEGIFASLDQDCALSMALAARLGRLRLNQRSDRSHGGRGLRWRKTRGLLPSGLRGGRRNM